MYWCALTFSHFFCIEAPVEPGTVVVDIDDLDDNLSYSDSSWKTSISGLHIKLVAMPQRDMD